MQFTTTTEITRKGSKIFSEYDQAIVLNNNKNIGLLLGGELAQLVLDSGVIEKLKQQHNLMEEKNDYLKGLENNMKDWLDEENDNLFV